MIHSTAIISDTAIIAEDVEIGAYSVIGDQVDIGSGCRIDSHVVINGPTKIGEDNHIYQFASIGDDPLLWRLWRKTGHRLRVILITELGGVLLIAFLSVSSVAVYNIVARIFLVGWSLPGQ